jgi:hypothetical protein
MRIALALLLLVLLPAWAAAQGSIKGKIVDSSSKNALALATVTIFKASDTALVTYRLSNPEGEFRVPGIPLHLGCRVVISFSGYDVFRKEFTLNDDTPLDLGTVTLAPVSLSLEEVLVVAERPPVTVRRDTVEFNASSFKTLPTALVEDLLKKLPGIQVDREGNIMANGRRVNRIMVDGKAFFGDDPKMATRNLPANVIDKIQVTEDKDEAARNTDGDLTNIGQVINLTLKKGVKKGWFGKLYAGAGTEDRYEAGGIANIYRDTLQLSLIGFSNNINRSGFSIKEVQDLGGFSRSGFNSMMAMRRGSQEGFAINGISFGGLDAGISRSSGAGFNLNHAPNKKKTFFAQYFYGNNKNYLDELNNTQQFFGDTIVNTRTRTENQKQNVAHNIGTGATLKPDSLTDINFRASYSYATTDEDILARINVNNNRLGTVSTGAGNLFNNFYNNDYYHSLYLTRRFRAKKGRTLNLFNTLSYRNNLQRFITESDYDYYYPADRNLVFEQMRRQDLPYLAAAANANFAEPLSKKWTLRFNNRYELLKDEQDVRIYHKDAANNKYDALNHLQGNGFERTQNRFSTNLSLNYKLKQVTLGGGATAMWQQIDNRFRNIAQPIGFRLFHILPTFSLSWKQLSVRYDKNVTAPSISYLTPVPDSSNPFFIRYGNPYLRPAKRHQLYINNFSFLQGSGTNYNVYVNANVVDDDVILSRTVATTGVQKVVPVNVNGTKQIYAGVGFGKEFKNKQKFQLNLRVSPYLSFDQRRLIVNEQASTATTLQYGPGFSMSFNWNDVIETRNEYRPSISRTRYTDPYFKNIDTKVHYLESELIVRWPKKLVWETNIAYRSTSQIQPGFPKDNLLWNAGVTLLMLKDSKGLLKLSVYDLLNRNNNLYRYITQNQIIDQQTNVLQRYALLSFTYNIRNMGAPKKVGGRDRLFMF